MTQKDEIGLYELNSYEKKIWQQLFYLADMD